MAFTLGWAPGRWRRCAPPGRETLAGARSSRLTQTPENEGDFIVVTQQKACLSASRHENNRPIGEWGGRRGRGTRRALTTHCSVSNGQDK